MSARTRALVARQGRKQHFATLGLGDTVWIPVCGIVDVPVFGAEVVGRDSWRTWLATAQQSDCSMCSRCRAQLLVAALALSEVRSEEVEDLRAEVRTLRADLARWTTAALAETKRHATFVREHVAFRRVSAS